VFPLLARGTILRRRRIENLLDRLDADRRAVRRLQRLHERHGDGPLLLRYRRRNLALVLAPQDVHRVLEESPEPFSPANREKVAALSHFEPNGVLVSTGPAREERRRFNEAVLESDSSAHRLGPHIAEIVADELLGAAELDWDGFAERWWRIVRRVVLGSRARDDQALTDVLATLRRDANWVYLKPQRRELRGRFLRELCVYVARAQPGCLASLVASTPAEAAACRVEQIPQWLFAFDAAGMATFRALALLAAHPEPEPGPAFLRACVLESLRLWPTTPAILRDTTCETEWANGTVPAGSAILIFAPFFHRDERRLPYADAFAPEIWLEETGPDPALVPFSAGPAECPGRNLVLLTTALALGTLLEAGAVRQTGGRRLRPGALPRTLSPFRLRFLLG
jgi:cytochrome P450